MNRKYYLNNMWWGWFMGGYTLYIYVTISFSHWRDYKRYYVLVFLPQQPQ